MNSDRTSINTSTRAEGLSNVCFALLCVAETWDWPSFQNPDPKSADSDFSFFEYASRHPEPVFRLPSGELFVRSFNPRASLAREQFKNPSKISKSPFKLRVDKLERDFWDQHYRIKQAQAAAEKQLKYAQRVCWFVQTIPRSYWQFWCFAEALWTSPSQEIITLAVHWTLLYENGYTQITQDLTVLNEIDTM